MDQTARMTPSEASRRFVMLLKALSKEVDQLDHTEKSRAEHLQRDVAQEFQRVIAEGDDTTRAKLLIKTRDFLTELERLLAGQRMMFAFDLVGRVLQRHIEALEAETQKVFKELFDMLDGVEALIEADTMRQLGIKPKPQAPGQPRKKAPKTYAKAQDDIMRVLHGQGWKVSGHLKIPHATSPDNNVRFWFKPQAIYMSYGPQVNDMHSARSIWAEDYRFLDPGAFVKQLEKLAAKYPGGLR